MGGIAQGAGTVVAAKMQTDAQNKATASQERANREALAFSKEQEKAAQGRYGMSKGQYDQQVADWYAARNALLGRYGVDISLGSGGVGAPGSFPSVATPPIAQPRGKMGSTLGEIATSDPATDWADWSRYNLGAK